MLTFFIFYFFHSSETTVIWSMNDLGPVALTSAVMKVCERVVLCKLEKLVKDYIDPLEFAYRKNRSTDDAVLFSLENIPQAD